MKKLLLIFLMPLAVWGQDVTRDWSNTSLTVKNITVSGAISGSAELEFDTVVQMKAFDFSQVADGSRVKCNGYHVANDGFFGPDVFWNATSTATGNGLSVFDPDISGAGRLIRSFATPISVKWGGARGYASSLTGTISTSGTTLTGAGTLFSSELSVGDDIMYKVGTATFYVAEIATITDDTNATITTAFETDASSDSYELVYDESPYIQSVLDYMLTGTSPARRGKVLIPPGSYVVNTTLEVRGLSVEVEGEAGEIATKLIGNDLSGPVIELTARRQALRNIDIDATEERAGEIWRDFDHGIVVEASDTPANYPTHIHLENVYVQNQPGSGIVVQGGAWFSKLERITVRDSRAHGIVYSDGSYPSHLRSMGTNGAITASDNTLTLTVDMDDDDSNNTSAFTDEDHTGRWVRVVGAGTAGLDLITTIASRTSGSEVELTDAASTTVSGAQVYFLSRVNNDVPNGIADFNLVEVFDCDGHGMLLGNPQTGDTSNRVIRMQLRNVDVGRNAQAAGPRLVAAQLYGFMDTSIITHSAFDGKDKLGTTAETRNVEVHGKNIKITNNRMLNPIPQSVKIGGAVNGFTSENIVIEDNYVVKGSSTIWSEIDVTDGAISASDNTLTSATNPFIAAMVGYMIRIEGAGAGGADLYTTIASYTGAGEVEITAAASTTVTGADVYIDDVYLPQTTLVASGASIEGIVNQRWSGGTHYAENPYGTSDGNSVETHETIVRYVLTTQTVNNSTTLVELSDLTIPLLTFERATFDFVVFYNGDSSADIKFQVQAPSNAVLYYSPSSSSRINGGDAWSRVDAEIAGGGTYAFGSSSNARMAHFKGYVKTEGVSGNLTFHFAQGSAVVADTDVITATHVILRK